jgi:AcrR family transcriptional regulator
MAGKAPAVGGAPRRAARDRPGARVSPAGDGKAEPPGRRRLTRDEKKAQTRAQLLDAADRVFRTKGFFAASLDDVADEAGYSKGAVYSNFDSKEDLFYALIERTSDQQAAALVDSVERDAPVGTQARKAGDRFVQEQWNDNLGPADLEFRVCVARNPELRERMVPRTRALRAAIAQFIEQGAAARGTELRMPPDRLAILVQALMNGLALERVQDPEGFPDELVGQALEIVFSATEVGEKG